MRSSPLSRPVDAATAADSTDATAPGKRHYVVLDGLRGVASVLVVVFHLFEAYAGGDPVRQIINHGYLAVDFFFVLSGFVVAYAYDDRWGRLTLWGFCRRRLIRLQPMVVAGSVIGALMFYFAASPMFPKVAGTRPWQVGLVMLVGFTLIPLPKGADIRGWDETYPLNGPAWSLFYEYGANLLYALGLRRLSNRAMGVLVAAAALALLQLAVFGREGDLIGGWSLDVQGVRVGLTRVMFPFFAGVLLMRLGWRVRTRAAFGLASGLLIAALALPRLGGHDHRWINGLYEAACVILLFPLVVAIGAGEAREDTSSVRVARVFGELSYPLYITHYPLIYAYTAWVTDRKVPPAEGALAGAGVLAAALAIAWVCLKLYDEPVRRWLAARFLPRSAAARQARG
ncbi:MAG: acyltransferase [Caulobacteraceae bacterium]|nr:acyltransferase [Caulobacter sp.]